MSETEGRQVLVLEGKHLQVLDNLGELGKNEVQSLLLEDEIGIVGHC